MTGVVYESVVKVNVTDDPAKRARDIADGIGYACALLMDEYGWSSGAIADMLERTTDGIYDEERRRA